MENKKEIKFQLLIRSIIDILRLPTARALSKHPDRFDNNLMKLIYDLDKLNDLAKFVFENTIVGIEYSSHDFLMYADGKDAKYIRWFIEEMNSSNMYIFRNSSGNALKVGSESKTLFLFWAMMILAVDNTDAEEHLETICDYADMLHVDDYIVVDIAEIIKMLLNHKDNGDKIKTDCGKELYGYLKSLIDDKSNTNSGETEDAIASAIASFFSN